MRRRDGERCSFRRRVGKTHLGQHIRRRLRRRAWIQHGRVAVFAGGRLDRPRLGERGGYSGKKLHGRRDAMRTLRDVCRRDSRGVLHMCPTDWTARVTDAGFRRRYRD